MESDGGDGAFGAGTGMPVQILDFKEKEIDGAKLHYLELNKNGLDSILRQIGDKQVVIISVVGESRQGKSFLLSFLIRCLKSLTENDESDWMGWHAKETPLQGFSWKNSSERETCGFWLWSTPFNLTKADGTEFSVLLMDTQGLFDVHTTQREWSIIVGLSLLTSSVLIFNVFTFLQENVLNSLEGLMQYGLLVGENEDLEKPFQKLMFLIRDWNNPGQYPYGSKGGDKFIKMKLSMETHMHTCSKQTRENIRKCFDEIECFLMPPPGEPAKAVDFNGALSGLDKKFANEMEKFVNNLLAPDNLPFKTIGGAEITGKMLGSYFEKYVEIFNTKEFPSPLTMYEATVRTAMQNIAVKAKDAYKKEMSSKIRGSNFISAKELKRHHETALKKAKSLYNKQEKPGNEKIAEEFLAALGQEISQEFEKITLQNDMKRQRFAENLLDEVISTFKKEIDDELADGKFMEPSQLKKCLVRQQDHAIEGLESSLDGDSELLNTFKPKLENEILEVGEKYANQNSLNKVDAERKNQSVIEQYLEFYETEMDQVIGDGKFVGEQQFNEAHELAFEKTFQAYSKHNKVGTKALLKEYEKKLNAEILKLFDTLKKQNSQNRQNAEHEISAKVADVILLYGQEVREQMPRLETEQELDELQNQIVLQLHTKFLDENNLDPESQLTQEILLNLNERIDEHYRAIILEFQRAKKNNDDPFLEFISTAKSNYSKEMEQALESDIFCSPADFATLSTDYIQRKLHDFEFLDGMQNHEDNKFFQQMKQDLEEMNTGFVARHGTKIELLESRALNIVAELRKDCQEEMKKRCSTVKTENEFKQLHETSKLKAVNLFEARCGSEISAKYQQQLIDEIDETLAQLLELYKMKQEEMEIQLKAALEDAKLKYKNEMDKKINSCAFIEPDVLEGFHNYVSARAARNCQPQLESSQEVDLLKAMDKLFISYKEQNALNTPANNVAIGIDLGTTYSCVGIYLNGQVKIIPNRKGKPTTPSYVAFKDSSVLVGNVAKDQAHENPEYTIFDAKRLIGRKFNDQVVQDDMKSWPFQVVEENGIPKVVGKGGKTYHPEQISAEILKEMKAIAEEYLGNNKTVENAVITVPAYFTDGQKQATIDAGELAGLKVLSIIHEPTSAAMAYRIQHSSDVFTSRCALIFDLGGGTFDVALLTISSGEINVKEIGGDTHLGGEDFDRNLLDFCLKEFNSSTGIDLAAGRASTNVHEKTAANKALRRLRNECERRKKDLSSATEADIMVDAIHGSEDLHVTITREKFEELNDNLFIKTIEEVKKVLKNAGLEPDLVEDVVLVGGSTRIPKVQKLLSEFFGGKTLNKTVNPDEAVAYGAAIQAAILNGAIAQESGNYVKLKDVTPHSLGIEVADYADGSFSIIIPKSSTTPVEKTGQYTTFYDNQTSVRIIIFEGEEVVAVKNHKLGEFDLNGIPPAPAGQPLLDVTMKINDQGILHVTAKCCSTGDTADLTITEHNQRLSRDTINRLLSDGKSL